MRIAAFTVLAGLASIAPIIELARAQMPVPQFVPIILDEAKFNLFVGDLEKVPMPVYAYRQVMQLLQNLETQAQQDKRAAEAKDAPAK